MTVDSFCSASGDAEGVRQRRCISVALTMPDVKMSDCAAGRRNCNGTVGPGDNRILRNDVRRAGSNRCFATCFECEFRSSAISFHFSDEIVRQIRAGN